MQQAADAAAAASPVETVAPPTVPGRVLDVDADMICYWAGGNEDTTVQVSRMTALNKIEFMRSMSGAESVVCHLTADSSTKADRRIIATTKVYQGQRKSGRKPKNWGYLRDFFTNYRGHLFTTKVWATREADDGICYAMHSKGIPLGNTPNRVVASADKDMRMFPGWHIDWNTGELIEVPLGTYAVRNRSGEKLYGHKWFWMQMLQGDTADNIPGLPRLEGKEVGPKRAEKLLVGTHCNEEAAEVVTTCYQLHYGAVEDWLPRFVEQGLLLWMRRDAAAGIWDFRDFLLDCIDADSCTGAIDEVFLAVEQRIKEAYAAAQSLGSFGVQSDSA